MNSLKQRWDELSTPVKAGVGLGAAFVAIIFVVKILPLLIAALGLGALLAILFIPYWIPTIVAFVRKHPSKGAILALNFFFGWTFIGWVLCLVWALSNNSSRTPNIIVNTHVSPTFSVGNTSMAPSAEYRTGEDMAGNRHNGSDWQHDPAAPRTAPIPPRSNAGPNR
jgi:Superinfection immunity protein